MDRFGWLGLIRLLFSPLTTLITTPVRLVQSLWSCRVLIRRRWENYNGFSAYSGIAYLIYWTLSKNIQNYGRHGVSKTLGLGKVSLSSQFYLTSLSLHLFHKLGGAVSLIIGMFGWWASYLVFFDLYKINIGYGIICLLLALISVSFYVNLLYLQNYHVFGWMLFPICLLAIFTCSYYTAAIIILAISFLSFTLFHLSVLMVLTAVFIKEDLFLLLVLVPAVIKMFLHILPIIKEKGRLKNEIMRIAGIIGTYRNVRYRYTYNFGIQEIYFVCLWGSFALSVVFLGHWSFGMESWGLSILLAIPISLWIINNRFYRFTDDHNLYMLFFTIATFIILKQNSYVLLPIYWIAVSPIPLTLLKDLPSEKNVLDILPEREPFDISGLVSKVETFFSQISKQESILFAWNDPCEEYGKIFDSYRIFYELILYAANIKDIHVFPNWIAISDTNLKNDFEGNPHIWGREIESVRSNLLYWKTKFVIIYHESGTPLDSRWELNGFKHLAQLNWNEISTMLKGQKLFSKKGIDLWLMKFNEKE